MGQPGPHRTNKYDMNFRIKKRQIMDLKLESEGKVDHKVS